MIKNICLVLALVLTIGQVHAIKVKYDKITGITEAKSPDSWAKYNVWSGNFIYYHLASRKNTNGDVRYFLVFRTIATTNLLANDEPLFLLINHKERLNLNPIQFKQNEYGGMGLYWGFGISTYDRKVKQQLVYEVDSALLERLTSAEWVEARISTAKFDIDTKEISEFQKVKQAFNQSATLPTH